MSNQPEQAMTPQELRQALLAELDVIEQAIAELRNEELEAIVGGLTNDQKWGIGIGVPAGLATLGAASVYGARKYSYHLVKNAMDDPARPYERLASSPVAR